MIGFTIFMIALVGACIYLFRNRSKLYTIKKIPLLNYRQEPTGEYREYSKFNPLHLFVAIAIVVIGFIVALVQPYEIKRIEAGNIGVKVSLSGSERGVSDDYTYKTGWTIYNTWFTAIYEFPVYQQHVEYDPQVIITKGGFSATIKPTFNYSLKEDMVGDMFVNLRLNIASVEQGWLKNAIVGSVNDVANRWNVDDIFNKREEFEAAIVAECNKRVSKWFIVSQLRTNITPPPALKQAIENKTKAIQDVQVAENQEKVAKAEANRKVAIAEGEAREKIVTARGDSASLVIRAAAEQEAIKRKQLNLTSAYIEYLKIQKWDGVNSTTVLGSNGTMVNVK